MNWDTIEGNWKQLKGKLKQKWGELTDDDLDRIGGKKDELVGKLQERKSIARDVPPQVDLGVGRVGVLAARAAGPGEPPRELARRDHEPLRDDDVALGDVTHVFASRSRSRRTDPWPGSTR